MDIKLFWVPVSLGIFIVFLAIFLLVALLVGKKVIAKKIEKQALIDMHRICENTYPAKDITNSGTGWDKKNAYSFYQICLTVSSWTECSTSPEVQGFSTPTLIRGYDPAAKTQRNLACVHFNPAVNVAVVTFSGTVFLSEWTDDFDYTQKEPPFAKGKTLLVSKSQCEMYESMREQIFTAMAGLRSDTLVVVNGHSLGGALASFCFLDIVVNRSATKAVLYTFAMPRAGNIAFADFITGTTRSFRVCNTADIIPYFPLPVMGEWIFEHFGKLVSFTLNTGNLEKNHMIAYSDFLSKL